MAEENPTKFSEVYDCFLSTVTDDMYLELTPADTLKDLQRLLKTQIPKFEFPRISLNYTIKTEEIPQANVTEDDFVIEFFEKDVLNETTGLTNKIPYAKVDRSSFGNELTSEEINILALLMKEGWVQRQLTSIENTRMKYSGSDFKMTSQANHMAKLESLLTESRRDEFHHQRLYKRRKLRDDGTYRSNWSILRKPYGSDEI